MNIYPADAPPPPLRKCGRCGIEKPLTDFWRDQNRADGYRPSCRECTRIMQREYRSNAVTEGRPNHNRSIVIRAQNGRCAWCQRREVESDPRTSKPYKLVLFGINDSQAVGEAICHKCEDMARASRAHAPTVVRFLGFLVRSLMRPTDADVTQVDVAE